MRYSSSAPIVTAVSVIAAPYADSGRGSVSDVPPIAGTSKARKGDSIIAIANDSTASAGGKSA